MFIVGLGTATPAKRYAQKECWDVLQTAATFSQLSRRSQAILKKVLLGDNGIATRHLALDSLSEAFDLKPDALHARFCEYAPTLAACAAVDALREADATAAKIDAVLVTTCTGYLCPGLTSYVSERISLRPDILALDLVGQGCGAALPNLSTADALIASGRCRTVLSICVEVCSAAFYLDDDPGVLISACLFGDGAAALILSDEPRIGRRRIKWHSAGTLLSTEHRDALRFEQRNGMLRNILTRPVAGLAAQHAERVLSQVLDKAGLERDQITAWIIHAGGRDVLLAMLERLRLDVDDLRWSAAVLHDFGNLSSAFVYFVLRAAVRGNAPGGWWWLSSFGAGFSCHGAVLEVE